LAAERAAKVGTATALIVVVAGALVVYGIDQLSKFLIITNLTEGEVVPVLGTLLQWQFVRNPGAAFSLASGMTWIFTILAMGVITFIVWFARRIRSIAWASSGSSSAACSETSPIGSFASRASGSAMSSTSSRHHG
jgi:lipoprotein signal peptidase